MSIQALTSSAGANLQTKKITANNDSMEIVPDNGYEGFSKIDLSIPNTYSMDFSLESSGPTIKFNKWGSIIPNSKYQAGYRKIAFTGSLDIDFYYLSSYNKTIDVYYVSTNDYKNFSYSSITLQKTTTQDSYELTNLLFPCIIAFKLDGLRISVSSGPSSYEGK